MNIQQRIQQLEAQKAVTKNDSILSIDISLTDNEIMKLVNEHRMRLAKKNYELMKINREQQALQIEARQCN
jgi:iron only hydrogenase large subunit-like protein